MHRWLLALLLVVGCTDETKWVATDSAGASACTDCDCDPGTGCDFVCEPGAERCDVTCGADSDCRVDCGDAQTCAVTCDDAAACEVDCASAFSCEVACPAHACVVDNCELDTSCTVTCADGMAADPRGLGVGCGDPPTEGGGGIEASTARLGTCDAPTPAADSAATTTRRAPLQP